MSVGYAEGRVTRLRREVKVVMHESELPELSERLGDELGGLEVESTEIASVYFDRPGLPLWERARATPGDCLKIRTKEYFPDRSGCTLDQVVLEAKRERNGLTRKKRVWLPRSQLSTVIAGGGSPVARLITGGKLIPALAVTYVRQVYQASEDWRVTVDRDVCFYAVDSELALGSQRLTAARLGAPVAREGRVVVELKFMGAGLPGWLVELSARRCERFSKFGEGMARLQAARVDGVSGG